MEEVLTQSTSQANRYTLLRSNWCPRSLSNYLEPQGQITGIFGVLSLIAVLKYSNGLDISNFTREKRVNDSDVTLKNALMSGGSTDGILLTVSCVAQDCWLPSQIPHRAVLCPQGKKLLDLEQYTICIHNSFPLTVTPLRPHPLPQHHTSAHVSVHSELRATASVSCLESTVSFLAISGSFLESSLR